MTKATGEKYNILFFGKCLSLVNLLFPKMVKDNDTIICVADNGMQITQVFLVTARPDVCRFNDKHFSTPACVLSVSRACHSVLTSRACYSFYRIYTNNSCESVSVVVTTELPSTILCL